MSNPTNLQELATSIALIAEMHRTIEMPKGENALAFTAYHMGARDALLDLRATVLAMHAEQRPKGLHKASPDPDYSHLCIHCMLNIKHLPAGQGWVHEGTGMVVGDGPADVCPECDCPLDDHHEACSRLIGGDEVNNASPAVVAAMNESLVRYQFQVLVDGTPMMHGPFDPTSASHPRTMAATYQDINPEATVTIEYRDNEGDGVWTTNEPNGLPA